MEEKKFVSDEARYRAIHMLQWLTYGEEMPEEINEHELLLNKLLCGVEIAEPVPLSVVLTEKEKEEAESLLKAVIANWTIIKRSSFRALRSFFRKEGRLTRDGSDWDLLIQRDSATEILIDNLPWSISIVKMPWNEHTIYVEW